MADLVNPWTYKGWNLTAQGQVVRKFGMAKAEAMARAADTTVGGPRPKPDHNVTVHQTFLFRKVTSTSGGGGGGLVGAGSSGDGPPE
jgi:hypothetical protein